ncbi:MAG: hypothetical protein LBV55_01810 [Acholeplasmatales bacterium]|jgi:hypothetical protein|nr:hypothetical protein [Acholeplasmatales bacterium]
MKKIILLLNLIISLVILTSCQQSKSLPFVTDWSNPYEVIDSLEYVGVFKISKYLNRPSKGIVNFEVQPLEFISNENNLNLTAFSVSIWDDYKMSTAEYRNKYVNKYCLLGGGEKFSYALEHSNRSAVRYFLDGYNPNLSIINQNQDIVDACNEFIQAVNKEKFILSHHGTSLIANYYLNFPIFDTTPYLDELTGAASQEKINEILWSLTNEMQSYYFREINLFLEQLSLNPVDLAINYSYRTPSFNFLVNSANYESQQVLLEYIAANIT